MFYSHDEFLQPDFFKGQSGHFKSVDLHTHTHRPNCELPHHCNHSVKRLDSTCNYRMEWERYWPRTVLKLRWHQKVSVNRNFCSQAKMQESPKSRNTDGAPSGRTLLFAIACDKSNGKVTEPSSADMPPCSPPSKGACLL